MLLQMENLKGPFAQMCINRAGYLGQKHENLEVKGCGSRTGLKIGQTSLGYY